MKRFHALTILGACALFAISLLHPAIASAQPALPADPSAIFAGIGTGWFTTLQAMAARLYGALFTLEVIVVCVQGALYKDNIAEFFQGFAFKILTATVMLAVIGNAGTIFPAIVGMFQTTAATVVNKNCSGPSCVGTNQTQVCADATNSACTATTIANPSKLETDMLLFGAQYFIAADASRAADSAEAAIAGIVVFGTGVPGLSTAFLMGHENFSLFCIALGMTCVMSAAGVLLTYLLLTFETQIVMMIGVIFLAFQGSRYTAQFSQGYMSYCINIGTKFFVFYFMVSILQQLIEGPGASGIGASIASLVAGAAIPFGAGSIVLVATSSPVPVICIISSILVAAIPNFAGSLLQGSSALSAGAALQNGAVQSMAGAVGGGVSGGFAAAAGGAKMAGAGSGGSSSNGAGGSPSTPGSTSTDSSTSVNNNVTLGPSESSDAGAAGAADTPPTTGSTPTKEQSLLSDIGPGLAMPTYSNGGGGGSDASYARGGGGGGGSDAYAGDVAAAGAADEGAAALADTDTSDGTDAGPTLGPADDGSGDAPTSDDAVNAKDDEEDVPLNKRTPDQLREMSPDEVRAAAEYTNVNAMSKAQIDAIREDPEKSSAATSGFAQQAANSALSGLSKPHDYSKDVAAAAQAMQKGEQPPPAVQVRVTNPDKL